MKSASIILLIVLVQAAYSKLIYSGQCPEFTNPLEKTFNFDKFTGTWYAVKSSDAPNMGCESTIFKNNYNGTFTAYDMGYDLNTGKPITAIYPGKIIKGPNLSIRFSPTQNMDIPNNVLVGIDYKVWLAARTCTNISKTQYTITALIASRKFPMAPADLEKAYAALRYAKVDLTKLVDYNKRNCIF